MSCAPSLKIEKPVAFANVVEVNKISGSAAAQVLKIDMSVITVSQPLLLSLA